MSGIFHLKPIQHLSSKSINSLLAIAKLSSYFFAVVSFSHQLQYFKLLIGNISFLQS